MQPKEVLELILNELPETVISEYRPTLKRRYRLDYCVMYDDKPLLGIEYHGLSFRGTNSGHQTSSGAIRDHNKQNTCLELGIPVLQYNCISIQDVGEVERQIKAVIAMLIQSKFTNH